jgi:two-component system OmpR family response regulator/two-component system response regulator CpxR
MTEQTILLVDDDQDLAEMLKEYLEAQGFHCFCAHNGEAALSWLEQQSCELIVLDVMMPGMSGLELLPLLRARWDTPVIMLTGRGDDIDRIIGLEMGADDYLAKPCNPRELLARINAVLRRQQTRAPTPTAVGGSDKGHHKIISHNIELDPGQRKASHQHKTLSLTTVEFDMLELLMRHAGSPVSKDTLSEQALQRKLSAFDRSVDVHISRLRNKLKPCHTGDDLIKTVRGQGYQFISE